MNRRLKALLVFITAAGALPLAAPAPATADWLAGGCQALVVPDPTDPRQTTWIELTTSYFLGTPDVSSFAVTCWLQTGENLNNGGIDSTEADTADAASWGNPQPVGELANTRHTCSDSGPANACTNPVVYQVNSSIFYLCTHVTWTDSANPGAVNPLQLVEDLLRDFFSTGGITTMGDASQIVATATLAVTNLVAALTAGGGAQVTHTWWVDAKPLDNPDGTGPLYRQDGIQCKIA